MPVSYDPNHAAEALAELASQYRYRPQFEGLQTGVGTRAQTIEDVLWAIYTTTGIAPNVAGLTVAQGVYLDRIGKIVGQARNGLVDAEYVLVLQARIRVLFSAGTIPDLQTILQLLTSNTILIEEMFPAVVVVQDLTAVEAYPSVIFMIINEMHPAGVLLHYQFVPSLPAFTYDTGPGYNIGHYAGVFSSTPPVTGP